MEDEGDDDSDDDDSDDEDDGDDDDNDNSDDDSEFGEEDCLAHDERESSLAPSKKRIKMVSLYKESLSVVMQLFL